jgi:predicted TPR repeat methyltransferase
VLRYWPWLAGAALTVAAVLIIRAALQPGPGSGGSSFPPPLARTNEAPSNYDDFVGSDECEECHKAEYDAWTASTHGNAGGTPDEVRIIAPFDGTPIQFRDGLVTPTTTEDGKLVFIVQQQGEPERTFEVSGVVGGGHMVGGGTQAFFADYPDGTFRFLPFDYIRQEGVWFCQTDGRSNQGWAPITPETLLADCNDWPPVRVLGTSEGGSNCQQCHGSQITIDYDVDARRYETRFTTLAINCESCHGPGRRHIEIADSDSIDVVEDIGVEALAVRDKDGSLEVCFQCHAVKAELRLGYNSGMPPQDYFSDLMLLLSYRPYFPDGRIRLFAYQQQHLYSDCYLNGSMTCVDCHDPHSQRYRDIWGEPLVGRFSDGQCLDCHPSKAEEVEVARSQLSDSLWAVQPLRPRSVAGADTVLINAHTYHPVGTPGGRCIDCHMPFPQEPDVDSALRYSRSDHTIPIPRPGLDAFFGIENACAKCHRDLALTDVQQKVTEWYGELKPPKALIRGLIDTRGAASRAEAARLMLGQEEDKEYVALQFTNLGYFMLQHLTPDMPSLESSIVEQMQQLAGSDDPDLRALALASLHLARGRDPRVRSFLAEQLRGLESMDWAIRRRWVWVLNFRGESYLGRNELPAALATFLKAAEILPDEPEVLHSVGKAYGYTGDLGRAASYLRRSLEADPQRSATHVSLAEVLTRGGDLDGAVAAYRQAIDINPYETATFLSLGNTLLQARDVDGAINSYRRALILNPGAAAAYFALAQIFYQQGLHGQAIGALQRGMQYDRANAGARRLLEEIREAQGD